MLKNLAQAVSVVFHPIWMPMIGAFILLNHSQLLMLLPSQVHKAIYIIIASSTIGFPLLMLPIFIFRKTFKMFQMTQKQERYVPLFVMAIFYFFSYYTLSRLNVPGILTGFILGVFISTSIAGSEYLVENIVTRNRAWRDCRSFSANSAVSSWVSRRAVFSSAYLYRYRSICKNVSSTTLVIASCYRIFMWIFNDIINNVNLLKTDISHTFC